MSQHIVFMISILWTGVRLCLPGTGKGETEVPGQDAGWGQSCPQVLGEVGQEYSPGRADCSDVNSHNQEVTLELPIMSLTLPHLIPSSRIGQFCVQLTVAENIVCEKLSISKNLSRETGQDHKWHNCHKWQFHLKRWTWAITKEKIQMALLFMKMIQFH